MAHLAEIALAAMLSLTDEPVRPKTDTVEWHRYRSIATEMAEAVRTTPEAALPFQGPAGPEASVLALATVARIESQYREDLRTCETKGDSGRSVSMYQLYRGVGWGGHTQEEICSDRVLAGQLALRSLKMFAWSGTPLKMFRGYITGQVVKDHPPAAIEDRLFQKLLTDRKIVTSSGKGSNFMHAFWVPTADLVFFARAGSWAETVASERSVLETRQAARSGTR